MTSDEFIRYMGTHYPMRYRRMCRDLSWFGKEARNHGLSLRQVLTAILGPQ